MKKGDIVKIIGGNNEIGQPTMIGKVGVIGSVEKREYIVRGKKTKQVQVDFESGGHLFNDYHLEIVSTLKKKKRKIER